MLVLTRRHPPPPRPRFTILQHCPHIRQCDCLSASAVILFNLGGKEHEKALFLSFYFFLWHQIEKRGHHSHMPCIYTPLLTKCGVLGVLVIVSLSAATAATLSVLVSHFYSQPGVQGLMQFSHAWKNSASRFVNNASVTLPCPPNTHSGNPSLAGWLSHQPVFLRGS